MTTVISNIYLLDGASRQPVVAELHDGIEEQQLADWEALWRPAVDGALKKLHAAGVPRRQWPQSRHWDWRAKLHSIEALLSHKTFSVMCSGETQGMMAVNLTKTALIPEQRGKSLAYVEYLENAPWNRRELSTPRYTGVGTILLHAAIVTSVQEEFKGRIGLHSLPQADQFYMNCGMTDLGQDQTYHNLRYFEMTPDQAQAFVEKGGK